MTVDSFLDTNILVYAVDPKSAVDRKHGIALELLESADIGLSTQVLQEFYTVVTRKLKPTLSEEAAFMLIEEYLKLPVMQIDQMILIEGIKYSLKYRISYWDGAIIAAAERLKCKVLYTEDLNHRQTYGTVEVVNPFI